MQSRIGQDLDKDDTGRLTVEQVRRRINTWLGYHDLPQPLRDEKFPKELETQRYHQRRNATAIKSHTKTRIKFYLNLGIDVDKIKSCIQTR